MTGYDLLGKWYKEFFQIYDLERNFQKAQIFLLLHKSKYSYKPQFFSFHSGIIKHSVLDPD